MWQQLRHSLLPDASNASQYELDRESDLRFPGRHRWLQPHIADIQPGLRPFRVALRFHYVRRGNRLFRTALRHFVSVDAAGRNRRRLDGDSALRIHRGCRRSGAADPASPVERCSLRIRGRRHRDVVQRRRLWSGLSIRAAAVKHVLPQ